MSDFEYDSGDEADDEGAALDEETKRTYHAFGVAHRVFDAANTAAKAARKANDQQAFDKALADTKAAIEKEEELQQLLKKLLGSE